MSSASILGGLVLLCCLQAAISGKTKSKDICVSPRAEEREGSSIDIGCNRKHVISQLDVTASNREDCGAPAEYCFGRSPDLIMHSNLCLWKDKCNIPFPNMKIVTNDFQTGNESCYYETAESVQVKNVRCVKQKDMSTMCDGKDIKSKSKGSLIRSHAEAPWFYDNENLFPENRSCLKSFNLGTMLKRKKQLAIEIRVFAICETEELLLKTSEGEIIEMEKDNHSRTFIYTKQDKQLTIEFSGNNETCGCEGFVICYKVYKNPGAVNRKVCEDLSKPASSITEKGQGDTEKKQRGKGGKERKRKSKENREN